MQVLEDNDSTVKIKFVRRVSGKKYTWPQEDDVDEVDRECATSINPPEVKDDTQSYTNKEIIVFN